MISESVTRKLDRYFAKDENLIGILVVDVQNKADLEELTDRYNVPTRTIVRVSKEPYCKEDEYPRFEKLIAQLENEAKAFFITELSTFCKLKGKVELKRVLKELLSMSNIAGYAVVLTYRCKAILQELIKGDPRLDNKICIVDGKSTPDPHIVLTVEGIRLPATESSVHGIDMLAHAIESELAETIYVKTKQSRDSYKESLFALSDLKSPYEVLCKEDPTTTALPENIGCEEHWSRALEDFHHYPSWESMLNEKLGDIRHLERLFPAYGEKQQEEYWQWLYFVALKLFGSAGNGYLLHAAAKADSPATFISNLYCCILELHPSDPDFSTAWKQRRELLAALKPRDEELKRFCVELESRDKNALHYLTDLSRQEKNLFFKLLAEYAEAFERRELMGIIKRVYPELHSYLAPYDFRNELFNSYFQDYKFQKTINKVQDGFLDTVEKLAKERPYNMIPARSSVVAGLNRSGRCQTYFTDAMGVEYLSYIMSVCQELELIADIKVSRCELPSLTSVNKEQFWAKLDTPDYPIIPFSELDAIKHEGAEGFDYSKEDKKLPLHLIRELELIRKLLCNIRVALSEGRYDRAILISDHGASRLAVIRGRDVFWEMEGKGVHSGRCCPKSELDEQPESATETGTYWVLANYDRFKGSRKAHVEVHGGASMEEVLVPVITICKKDSSVHVSITPKVSIAPGKKAALKVASSHPLEAVRVTIINCKNNKERTYDAVQLEQTVYVVDDISDIGHAGDYEVKVYSRDNLIAEALPLQIATGVRKRELF